jgi:hypothetical protein
VDDSDLERDGGTGVRIVQDVGVPNFVQLEELLDDLDARSSEHAQDKRDGGNVGLWYGLLVQQYLG